MIADSVEKFLAHGPIKIAHLVKDVASNTGCSIQAAYNAIHALEQKGILIVANKTAMLSLIYIERKIEEAKMIKRSYALHENIQVMQASATPQREIYFCQTLSELDMLATHVFFQISPLSWLQKMPFYASVPLGWFCFMEADTDVLWLKKMKAFNFRLIVTQIIPISQALIRTRQQSVTLEFSLWTNPLRQDSSEYYNIFGSWIMKLVIDPTVAEALSIFMKSLSSVNMTHIERRAFQSIVFQPARHRFILEFNPKKAHLLQKKFESLF